jgi:hypothetical protein
LCVFVRPLIQDRASLNPQMGVADQVAEPCNYDTLRVLR